MNYKPALAVRGFPLVEMKSLFRLAAPIIAAQLMQCLNSFIDTVMSGQHSPETLSQVAMGSSIWIPLLIFSSGIFSGVSALSSHAFGAGDIPRNRMLFGSSLVLALIISVFMVLALRSANLLLPLFRVPDELAVGIIDYLDMVAWGFPALMIFWAMRGWVEGLHKTKLAMIASLIAVALNIPLNYLLIHGWGMVPALGAKGCGIATALSSCTLPFSMYWLLRRDITVQAHAMTVKSVLREWNLVTIKRMVKIGGPVGLTGFVEGSFFCVIAIMLAPLGATSVAAHQITLNISSMLFMVPLGLNFAITVAVGKALGEGRSVVEMRRLVHSGIYMALLFALCSCSFLVAFRHLIPHLYTDDVAVITLATHLLIFAAIFQIPDGLQVALYGVLKGLQDTFVPFLIAICAYWLLGATLGYSFTFFDTFGAMGAQGAWLGLNIGLTVSCAAFLIRTFIVFRRRLNSNLL